MNPKTLRPLVAELAGTALFVFFGAGAIAATLAAAVSGGVQSMIVAAAHGVGMAIIVSATEGRRLRDRVRDLRLRSRGRTVHRREHEPGAGLRPGDHRLAAHGAVRLLGGTAHRRDAGGAALEAPAAAEGTLSSRETPPGWGQNSSG